MQEEKPTRGDYAEAARYIGRDLAGTAIVWVTTIGCVILGGVIGNMLDDESGGIAGIFVGLGLGVPLALLLGSWFKGRVR